MRAIRVQLHRIRARVGRRGASLAFLAFLALVFAGGLLSMPAEVATGPGYRFMDSVMPLEIWAVLWVAVGAVCLVQAFTVFDRLAFGLAVALLVGWGGAYAIGWAFYGVDRAYVSAVLFLAFAAWVFIISGWSEEEGRHPLADMQDSVNAVVTIDPAGRIRAWNLAAEVMFGWRAHEVISQPSTMIIPVRFRKAHEVGLERVRLTGNSEMAGNPRALVGLHRDGTEFPVELTISEWSSSDGSQRFTGILRALDPEEPQP